MVGKIGFNTINESIGEVAIFGEIGFFFEIDNFNFWGGGRLGFFSEGDESMSVLGEIIIRDERSGGALETSDV